MMFTLLRNLQLKKKKAGRPKNSKSTSKETILLQMGEPRPLPMGRKEFEEWSDRIISGALIPGGYDDPEAFINGQKFTLTNMLLHLGPTESHKPDAYFIHCLRKFAINQVADAMCREYRDKAKARLAAKEAAEQKACEACETEEDLNAE